jgi:hypothetical protein
MVVVKRTMKRKRDIDTVRPEYTFLRSPQFGRKISVSKHPWHRLNKGLVELALLMAFSDLRFFLHLIRFIGISKVKPGGFVLNYIKPNNSFLNCSLRRKLLLLIFNFIILHMLHHLTDVGFIVDSLFLIFGSTSSLERYLLFKNKIIENLFSHNNLVEDIVTRCSSSSIIN